MELALLLYVASIAENFREGIDFFKVMFFIVGVAAGIGTLFSMGALTDEKVGQKDFVTVLNANRLLRRTFSVCFFSWVAIMLAINLTPSRRDVYVMAGGYVALKAVNSNMVQTTADSALNSIEKWLDKELAKELAKDEKSKKGNE